LAHNASTFIASEAQAPLSASEEQPVVFVRGTGSIGMRHLRVLRDMNMNAVAVPVRAARLRELEDSGFKIAQHFNTGQNSQKLAVIASASGQHLADALDALQHNCDVLVEKPLATTVDGLTQLKTIAANCGRRVFAACSLRFTDGLQEFRRQLNRIGRVHYVRIECQSFLPDWRPGRDYRTSYSARAGEGGVLLDLIHEIDYATWIFGRPQSVFAILQNTGQLRIESEEIADLAWTAPSGATVSMRLDYLTRDSRRKMIAYGESGELEWDGVMQCVHLRVAGKPAETIIDSQDRDCCLRRQARAFVEACSGTAAGDLCTIDEGAFAVALCDAARRSSASGSVEAIRDWWYS
jgi:predicted dehydrogenase